MCVISSLINEVPGFIVPFLLRIYGNYIFSWLKRGEGVKKLDFFVPVYDDCIMDEKRNTRISKSAIYLLVIVVILILILLFFLYLIHSPLIFRSGAYTSTTTVTQTNNVPSLSTDNSYVFASPLRAKANGEQIRITVFILDDRGIGMSGKTVSIGGGDQLQVTPVQPVTDSQGRATFDISSGSTPGVYIIQAATGGVTLTQKATVTFD